MLLPSPMGSSRLETRTAGPSQRCSGRSWLAVLVWLVLAGPVAAHEIPSDVSLSVYLKPDGDRLTAVIRAPLAAMRDVRFATRGPGYLVLEGIEPALETAARLWLLDNLVVYEDGTRLGPWRLHAVRVALPGDRSFDDYDSAATAVRSVRLDPETTLYWEHALIDLEAWVPISARDAAFAVEPTFARLGIRTRTRIVFLPPGRPARALSIVGDPGYLNLEPGSAEVLWRFLGEGFTHVLDGADHVLFLFVLVIPLVRIVPLVVAVTAFTIGHSLTLGAAALELVPRGSGFDALTELVIAASIVWMALENVLKRTAGRWRLAFGFGLVHGFGFSVALAGALPFAGGHLAASLIGFDLGIELGQLLLVASLAAALWLLYRWLPERPLVIVLSALAAHTAWHWLVERWAVWTAVPVSLPDADMALVAGLLRWLLLGCVAAFAAWLVRVPFDRWSKAP